jgi:uncharacterized repeat protein (TIGR01451 family)
MKFSSKTFSCVLAAAAISLAVCAATPTSAQTGPTLLQERTSTDGLLTLSLWSANGSDTVGVNNTYTWIATNNSATSTLTEVILGSHWGDRCPLANCGPTGPTLISLAPGCGGQSTDEFPAEIAKFGIWCTPSTGVTLQPGQSVSGSVTLRPLGAGVPNYTVYSGYVDSAGVQHLLTPAITNSNVVAPAATDIQMTGAASNGSPAVGSTFTYTYQIKNAGPWGTGGGLTFVDTLPAPLTYVSSSLVQVGIDSSTGQAVQRVNPSGCSVVGQTVSCRIGDLDNGGAFNQATIALTVAASGAPQQIVNTASVHTVSPQDDSNPTNNGVTVTVTTK